MNKCNLVSDLLPLYAEGLLSEDSKQLVERHLAKCAACSEKLILLKTPAAPSPRAESVPEEEVLKKTRRKLRKRTAIVAAAAVFLSAIVVSCAVFFPMRIKEVRNILYPYGVDGQPIELSSVWTYPTDSMIKLGEPIETYKEESPKDGDPFIFDNFHGFSVPDTPSVTLFFPEKYRPIDEGTELESARIFIWARENSFESVFGIGQNDVSSDAPVAVYCKEHSLTTWTEIADYTITYRKSEFSLLFSPNSAVRYTADIFRVRDVVIGTWTWTVKDGRCYPQVYHPFRGSFEGYAFSHEGAQGNWDIFVTTEQFVYHVRIVSLEGERVLFPDEESIAKLLSTARFK